jgi:hypothetical protein
VYATSNTLLTVKNVLQVDGEALLPVIFTVNSTSSTRGQWRGIQFTTGNAPYVATAAAGIAQGSFIKHAMLQYTGQSNQAAILVAGAAPLMQDIILDTIGQYGVFIKNTVEYFTVTRLTIANGQYYGVWLENGLQCRLQPCIIEQADISGVSYGGVYMSNIVAEGSVIIRDSLFNGYGVRASSSTGGVLTVFNSTFVGGSNHGVSTSYLETNITQCTFKGGSQWSIYSTSSSSAPMNIESNLFTGGQRGLYVYSYQPNNLVVRDNKFEGMSDYEVWQIQTNTDASHSAVLEDNHIFNSWGTTATITDSSSSLDQNVVVANTYVQNVTAKEDANVSA